MPILDVTIVGGEDTDAPARAVPEGGASLAQRLADAAGAALGTAPGHTWVRVHRLAAEDYAENGGGDARPVFVTALMAEPRAELASPLCRALAAVLRRDAQHVHVVFEPGAAGRIAFGGALRPLEPRRATSGARWEAIVGYSRAVRVDRHVFVTGTTAFGAHGEPTGGDAYAQARQALANVVRALAALEAVPEHVVRTRMFVVDIERDWEAVGRAHAELFGEVRPATTMVEVRRLIEPWMLVEIEADAYVTPRGISGGG